MLNQILKGGNQGTIGHIFTQSLKFPIEENPSPLCHRFVELSYQTRFTRTGISSYQQQLPTPLTGSLKGPNQSIDLLTSSVDLFRDSELPRLVVTTQRELDNLSTAIQLMGALQQVRNNAAGTLVALFCIFGEQFSDNGGNGGGNFRVGSMQRFGLYRQMSVNDLHRFREVKRWCAAKKFIEGDAE